MARDGTESIADDPGAARPIGSRRD